MKRYIASITLGLLLILFLLFTYYTTRTHNVLYIKDLNKIIVDINNNGIADTDETICISNIETITNENTESYDLSATDFVLLKYVADEFVNKLLTNTPVKVKLTKQKTKNCVYGDLILPDEQKYSDILYSKGFASKNGKVITNKINENLEKAKRLDLVILNRKNNIYHTLTCEYGNAAQNSTILPKRQLPKEAKPCKVCHLSKNIIKRNLKFTKYITNNNGIKFIISDYTNNKIIDRKCDDNVCKILLDNINQSKESIDFAVFGWAEFPEIKNALIKAKMRGVKIRVITDAGINNKNNYYPETDSLIELADEHSSDFNINDFTSTNYLMHNKFIIFDKKIVLTGSMNISTSGLTGFNENIVIVINSDDIANYFTYEFEQMINLKFHKYKLSQNKNNTFNLNNSIISVYFSPYDNTSKYIIPLINNAKHYIYVPTYLITHKGISNALINAHKRGVDVRLIIDANNALAHKDSHSKLRNAGLPLKTEIYAGRLHSKSMIIDDKYVITGSMNFSYSGEKYNDENCLIINDEVLAKSYKEYFLFLWNSIPDIWLIKYAKAESIDSIGSCTDGIDNDYDGKIDIADEGCH